MLFFDIHTDRSWITCLRSRDDKSELVARANFNSANCHNFRETSRRQHRERHRWLAPQLRKSP